MKKGLLFIISSLILGGLVYGQEKIKMQVKVIQNGEVVKDTSYEFNDAAKAKHAMHMMEMISSEDMESVHKEMMSSHDAHKKHMIFMSEDGEVHELKGDEMKWESKAGSKDSLKKYKVIVSDGHGEHGNVHYFSDDDGEERVFINEEDGQVEIIVKKIAKGEGKEAVKVKKEIIVITDGDDEDVEWNIKEGEDVDVDFDSDVDVIVIKKEKVKEDDGDKMDIKVTIDDSESDVKKKKGKKKKEK